MPPNLLSTFQETTPLLLTQQDLRVEVPMYKRLSFSGTGLFSGNVAHLDGGAIYPDGSNLSFSGDVTITNNNGQLGGEESI